MDVSVIHLAPFLMERQLDAAAGRLLQNELEKQGMTFFLEKQTEEILGTDRVEGVRFKDGTSIEADLVVMAVGIRPNTQLGTESGIPVNRGIIVNDYMQTDIPHIYAVGECAEHRGIAYGLVAPLYEQAKVLAKHLCGIDTEPYEGSVLSTQLKVSGVEVFSAGDFNESEDKKRLKCSMNRTAFIKNRPEGQSNCRRCFVRRQQRGQPPVFNDSKQADISETSKISILQPLDQEAGASMTAAMSDDEIICGCNGVSKGAIIQAIQEKGCTSTDEIKACTGASRSCGGCKPLVEDILQYTLGSEFDASAQKKRFAAAQHCREMKS